MKIYFACPSGKRRDMIVNNHKDEFGACLTRDTFKIKIGAFSDFKRNDVFNSTKFYKRLLEVELKVRQGKLRHPDFTVVPDLVCGGNKSLVRSLEWIDYLNENFPHHNYYLAVQDGMKFEYIENVIKARKFDGIFIGGSKAWKYENSEALAIMAHKYGLPIHCGGIGTPKDILWSRGIGIDSVDSGIAMICSSKYLNEVLNIKSSLLWVA
jgi:Queuine tRNA-ribosyltransferase